MFIKKKILCFLSLLFLYWGYNLNAAWVNMNTGIKEVAIGRDKNRENSIGKEKEIGKHVVIREIEDEVLKDAYYFTFSRNKESKIKIKLVRTEELAELAKEDEFIEWQIEEEGKIKKEKTADNKEEKF